MAPTIPNTSHGAHYTQYITWFPLYPMHHMAPTIPNTSHGTHYTQHITWHSLYPIHRMTPTKPNMSHGARYGGVTYYQSLAVVQLESGKGGSWHHCGIMYIQMTETITYVGGALVNSLNYADAMVLLGPMHGICSSDTLGGMSRICCTS